MINKLKLINCTYQFHGDSPKFNRTMTAQDLEAWTYKPQKGKKYSVGNMR